MNSLRGRQSGAVAVARRPVCEQHSRRCIAFNGSKRAAELVERLNFPCTHDQQFDTGSVTVKCVIVQNARFLTQIPFSKHISQYHMDHVSNNLSESGYLLCTPKSDKLPKQVNRHVLSLLRLSHSVQACSLCTVRCMVRYALYCTYRNFVNYGAITLLEDRNLP